MVSITAANPPSASPFAAWFSRRPYWSLLAVLAGAAALSTFFFAPRYWLWCFAGLPLGDLLLPAAHIIATPRSSIEACHRAPILDLYAEMEHARTPPDFASPEVYTRRGIAALQASRLDDAARQFEIALRYDPEFPRARPPRNCAIYPGPKKWRRERRRL